MNPENVEVVRPDKLSNLPKLMLGKGNVTEWQAREWAASHGVKTVFYWPSTKTAYIVVIERLHEKD